MANSFGSKNAKPSANKAIAITPGHKGRLLRIKETKLKLHAGSLRYPYV